MATKSGGKKYRLKASKRVKRAVDKIKAGRLKSGGSGTKAKSRKQEIAIWLSEARREGAKLPANRRRGLGLLPY